MSIDNEEKSTAPSASRIARSALLVIFVLGGGKAFSLLEKWVGLDRFGVSVDWDTFAAASQLTEQLFILIAGGALGYAFIPVFSEFLGRGQRQRAWRLASNVLNTVFLAALLLSIVVFIAAPWLVANVLAPGFASPYLDVSALRAPFDGEMIALLARPDRVMQTANLLRILLLSLIIFALSGLCSGILHTHQSFLWPSLAPTMFDVGNLIGVALLARWFGIYGAAMGAVIGAGLHLGIQVPGLIRCRARWMPYLNWRDPALREVVTLMIPRAIGLSLANASILIAYNIASTLEAGSVAAFNRGYTLMQLPQTLIGTAMGIVIFPALAMLSAAGDLGGKRSAMSGALRFVLIASIPAALMMIVAGRPLVGILEGGAFDPQGADRVYAVLQLFALGIITHSGVEVVARSFYADKDVIVPLAVQIVQIVLNVVLSLTFVGIFRVAGLALANSIAVGAEWLILMAVLRRRWRGIGEWALFTTTLKVLAASAVMVIVMLAVGPLVERVSLPIDRRFVFLLQAGLQVAVGGVVYLVMALVLRIDEVRELPRLLLRRRAAKDAQESAESPAPAVG